MAKHSTDLGHNIQFQDTKIVAMKTGCMECIIREFHPSNTNRGGFSLSKAWKLLLQTLKKQRMAPY
jgi:hypothetical protein